MFQTMKELARSIGVSYWRIQYAHEMGKLPEPMRIAGKRVYDVAQAEQVRQYFLADAQRRFAALQAG